VTIIVSMDQRLTTKDCCLECGRVLVHGDWPFCHGAPEDHGRPLPGRGADVTWPGGKTFENLADQPQTFYSKSEYDRYLRNHNIEEFVRHVPVPGSDKSPHTVSWAAVSQETLDGAKAMLERVGKGTKDVPRETYITHFEPATDVGVTTVRGSW
jgi:hypothetical protein